MLYVVDGIVGYDPNAWIIEREFVEQLKLFALADYTSPHYRWYPIEV